MIKSIIPTRTVGGTGILSLNAIEDQVQSLGVTTTGLDIGVTSLAGGAHTIVLPASGVSTVAGTVGLSSFGYWNDKADKITTGTGATSVAPGYVGAQYLDTSALKLFIGVTTAAGGSSWLGLN